MPLLRVGKHALRFLPPRSRHRHLNYLILSVDARDTEDSPPQSRAYEELVEVVTRAVDWPAEREDVRKKKKTNASCLVHNLNAGDCCFFPDLHTDVRDRGRNRFPSVYSTQISHYSSIIITNEHGYGEMPKVKETLACSLSPQSSSSSKSPVLPLNQ